MVIEINNVNIVQALQCELQNKDLEEGEGLLAFMPSPHLYAQCRAWPTEGSKKGGYWLKNVSQFWVFASS